MTKIVATLVTSSAASSVVDPTASVPTYTIADWRVDVRTDLNIVLDRLWGLLEKEDEDDVVPSRSTVLVAFRHLLEASEHLAVAFPRAAASTDGNGSVHFYWTKSGRMLQLTVPEEKTRAPFIYHRQGDDYGFERPISSRRLAFWLHWLASA